MNPRKVYVNATFFCENSVDLGSEPSITSLQELIPTCLPYASRQPRVQYGAPSSYPRRDEAGGVALAADGKPEL
jgi:hypothetical protein